MCIKEGLDRGVRSWGACGGPMDARKAGARHYRVMEKKGDQRGI